MHVCDASMTACTKSSRHDSRPYCQGVVNDSLVFYDSLARRADQSAIWSNDESEGSIESKTWELYIFQLPTEKIACINVTQEFLMFNTVCAARAQDFQHINENEGNSLGGQRPSVDPCWLYIVLLETNTSCRATSSNTSFFHANPRTRNKTLTAKMIQH